MTIQSNLEDINDQLDSFKSHLVRVLESKIDRNTKEYFDVNSSMSLTLLCQKAQNIYGEVKKTATLPTYPHELLSDSIYAKQLDIHNKVQYCNNLLRYALKIYDIDFQNSNRMHELISYLDLILQIPTIKITENYSAFRLNEFFVFNPSFTEENPANLIEKGTGNLLYSSQSNGVWESLGYYLADGWPNTGLWECDLDMSLTERRYVSIQILGALKPSVQTLISGWEGPIATNPPGTYTRDNDSTLSINNNNELSLPIPWFHINMKKTSPTTLQITKSGDVGNNGTVTYEWQNLSNYPKLTLGSRGNEAGHREIVGKLKIRNLIVRGTK